MDKYEQINSKGQMLSRFEYVRIMEEIDIFTQHFRNVI